MDENIAQPSGDFLLASFQKFCHRIARMEASISVLKNVMLAAVESAGGAEARKQLADDFVRVESEQPALRLEEADQMLDVLRRVIRSGSTFDA